MLRLKEYPVIENFGASFLATPSVSEDTKHMSRDEDGIPILRYTIVVDSTMDAVKSRAYPDP